MDVQILRAIVQSRSEVMKEVDDPEKFEQALGEEKFPPLDRSILTALSRSFADLISHKVSPEAYQRYSVRSQLIEILREWIRPRSLLNCSRTFYKSERVLHFATRMLKIYLTNELLYREDGTMVILVDLAKALLRLIPREKSLITDLERILERICELEPTADSQALLVEILESKDGPDLSAQVTEKLYVVERVKLIETPIVENLLENLSNSSSPRLKLERSKTMDELLEKTVDSSTTFQISCSVLKELFLHSKHSQRVLDFIKTYLESLSSLCQQKNRNILDLYPLRVQAVVILLRIAPKHHSRFSREHTIDLLMRLHENNPEETLILMTHFPGWLSSFSDRLAQDSRIENYRISGDTVTFDKSRSVSPMMID